jgi:hypothetical protein
VAIDGDAADGREAEELLQCRCRDVCEFEEFRLHSLQTWKSQMTEFVRCRGVKAKVTEVWTEIRGGKQSP